MAVTKQYNIPFVAATGTPSEVTVDIGTENTDWEAGDYAVIVCSSSAAATRDWGQKSGTTGWTELTSAINVVGLTLTAFWKKLAASEPDPTFIHASGGGADGALGVIIRGADPTTFLDGTVTVADGTDATATAPTTDTTTANAFVLRFYGWADNATAVGSYTGSQAEEFEHISADNTFAFTSETKASPGATGAVDAVASGGSIGSGDLWGAYTIPIKPAETTPDYDFLVTLADDYANLPAGGQEWLPNTVVTGDQVVVRNVSGAAVTDLSTYGVLVFEPGSTSTIEFQVDTGGSWSATDEVTFTDLPFAGEMRDLFTAASGTTLEGRSPTNGTGTWTVAKLTATSASPTGQVTIQSNALSAAQEDAGAVYDVADTNIDMSVVVDMSGADTRANIVFRRTDEDNYLVLNLRKAAAELRLAGRVGGTFATYATIADVEYTDSSIIRVEAIQNDIGIYVNGTQIAALTQLTNQEATATYIGLFAGGGTLPVVFDSIEVYQEDVAALPQEAGLSLSVIPAGAEVAVTISPEDEAPNSLTINGIAHVFDGSPTAAGGTFTAPVKADFLPAGVHEATPFGALVPVVVGFATAADITVYAEFIPSATANTSGYTDWYGTVSGEQAGNGIFASFAEGDGYWAVVTSGGIASITQDGVAIALEDGTADFYRYVAAWVAQTDLTLTYVPPSRGLGLVQPVDKNILLNPMQSVIQ